MLMDEKTPPERPESDGLTYRYTAIGIGRRDL